LRAEPDSDGDGCGDGEEVPLGTVFDPIISYDVYDVPVPALADPIPNGTTNRVVDIGDVLAVLFYAFAEEGGAPNANVSYGSDKGVDTDGISWPISRPTAWPTASTMTARPGWAPTQSPAWTQQASRTPS
jgi:hypothetical protein